MSIHAVQSPEAQSVLLSAISGNLTKSEFVDRYILTPSMSRDHHNRRKHRQPKQAMYIADDIERHFGWVWK
jgi:hypothetical protein